MSGWYRRIWWVRSNDLPGSYYKYGATRKIPIVKKEESSVFLFFTSQNLQYCPVSCYFSACNLDTLLKTTNPHAMKRTAKPSLYLSAYPLKAIKESSTTNNLPDSPYLRALLTGKTKSNNKTRVFSMIKLNKGQSGQVPFDTNKLPKDIELTEKDWFKNYE